MDVLALGSNEMAVFGGANGANTVVGYTVTGAFGDPGTPGAPDTLSGFEEIGMFNYTGQALYTKAPTSILLSSDPSWLDGRTPFAANTGWSIVGGNNNDTALGGIWNDTITAGNGANSVLGGNGADSIVGGTDADTIFGDAGADTILGGDGANSLLGGADADSIVGGTVADTILGEDGADTIVGGNGANSLLGGADADSIVGGTDADTILGEDGADTIVGGDGANSLLGGADADRIVGGADADTILGEAGANTIFGGNGADSLLGGAVADTILGEDGADTIVGGDGANSLLGGKDADSIVGGADADTILGEAGANTIFGGNGADSLLGGAVADTILGEAGDDTILGGGGADSIDGGDDNDRIIFSTSADLIAAASIIGGTGIDTVQLTDNAQTLVDDDFYKVNTIDVLQFADGNNAVTIDTEALDAFGGIAGKATIIGGSGNDTMTQSDGFTAGVNMQGGSGLGDDLFNIYSAEFLSQNTIAGGEETTVDKISVTTTTNDTTQRILGNVTGVEHLVIAAGANVSLTGAWGIETINGGAGNSTIDASTVGYPPGSGIVITGQNAGADSLIGGAGIDTLQAATSAANSNNDTLTGGAGVDLFVLGDGLDNFYGNTGTGSLASPNATITDFKTGEDVLRLFANGLTGSVEGTNYVTQESGAGTGDWKINLYAGTAVTGNLTYYADIAGSGAEATIYQKTGGSTFRIADLTISNPSEVANVFDKVEFVTPPPIV
jgi:Ca2+-binding RTX toxin-like protein